MGKVEAPRTGPDLRHGYHPMPQAKQNPITPDPAAEAARRVVHLLEEINANEVKWFQSTAARKSRLESEYEMLNRALSSAEEAISQRATTMAGAMAQILLAFADAQSIADFADERYLRHIQVFHQRLERCLSSAIAVLSDVSGINPAELGARYYCDLPQDNPHPLFEGAAAQFLDQVGRHSLQRHVQPLA